MTHSFTGTHLGLWQTDCSLGGVRDIWGRAELYGFGTGAGGTATIVLVLRPLPVQPAHKCHLAMLSTSPTQPILNLCWHSEVHSFHPSDSLGSRPTQLVNCWRHVPGWQPSLQETFLAMTSRLRLKHFRGQFRWSETCPSPRCSDLEQISRVSGHQMGSN